MPRSATHAVPFAEQRQLPPESNKWAEQSIPRDPNPRANQAEPQIILAGRDVQRENHLPCSYYKKLQSF